MDSHRRKRPRIQGKGDIVKSCEGIMAHIICSVETDVVGILTTQPVFSIHVSIGCAGNMNVRTCIICNTFGPQPHSATSIKRHDICRRQRSICKTKKTRPDLVSIGVVLDNVVIFVGVRGDSVEITVVSAGGAGSIDAICLPSTMGSQRMLPVFIRLVTCCLQLLQPKTGSIVIILGKVHVAGPLEAKSRKGTRGISSHDDSIFSCVVWL